MSAASLKTKGNAADAARTKKLAIGALGLIVVVYVGSSMMENGAKKAKPKLDTAAAAAAAKPGGSGKPATNAAGSTPVVSAPTPSSSVPTTTPWVPSPRNPFITVPQG